MLVQNFTYELLDLRKVFEAQVDNPPTYPHLPPVVSKLLWLRGLKMHIQVLAPLSALPLFGRRHLEYNVTSHVQSVQNVVHFMCVFFPTVCLFVCFSFSRNLTITDVHRLDRNAIAGRRHLGRVLLGLFDFRNRNNWNKPNNCSFSGYSHSRVAVKPS